MDWSTYLTPSLGVGGLLAAFVISVLTGKLLPRSSVEDRIADKDRQIQTWQENYQKAMAIQDEQRKQISALLEANRTTERVIRAIPRAAALNGFEGRADELAAGDDDQALPASGN